jgi:uncharacterized protein (DUF362 family)
LNRNSVNPNSAKPIVALAESKSHYNGVYEALELVENQIEEGLKGKKKILIKPNFVSVNNQLAATHVDAVRAVLDVVGKYYFGKIVVGEGPAFAGLKNALINFDFLKLQKNTTLNFLT